MARPQCDDTPLVCKEVNISTKIEYSLAGIMEKKITQKKNSVRFLLLTNVAWFLSFMQNF
jgi:hypothetical protein